MEFTSENLTTWDIGTGDHAMVEDSLAGEGDQGDASFMDKANYWINFSPAMLSVVALSHRVKHVASYWIKASSHATNHDLHSFLYLTFYFRPITVSTGCFTGFFSLIRWTLIGSKTQFFHMLGKHD